MFAVRLQEKKNSNMNTGMPESFNTAYLKGIRFCQRTSVYQIPVNCDMKLSNYGRNFSHLARDEYYDK